MTAAAALIECTNRGIEEFLKLYPPSDVTRWGQMPSAGEIETITTRLEQVDRVMRNQPELRAGHGRSAEFTKYSENLERLQCVLITIQPALLAQRARLEADRQHLAAASAWNTALNSTR